ncbi:MAG: ABC transporter permease [Gemmatimonadaceae bacterium]
MMTLFSDIRSALRQLRNRPGATVVSALALAAGIGAATAIFTVADATLLRPLPYPRPDELVRIWETTSERQDFPSAEPTFLDFQARTRAFAALAAMRVEHPSLTGAGEPERLDAAIVSATLFPLLGSEPALGRFFSDADESAGATAPVAMLSDGLWRRRFGADPSVVGRTIILDGEPHSVIGVLKSDFAFAPSIDLWLPLGADPGAERDNRSLDLLGRLKPGVTHRQAAADMERISGELAAEHPRSNSGWGVRLESFSDWIYGANYRRSVWVLFGAVGCLLLLACANVANLLVAQSIAREAEIGIRAALGASRSRIVRLLFTESVVLAILGGAGGALLAWWGVGALRVLVPEGGQRLNELTLNGRVLAFAVGMAAVTALFFGLVPALRAARVNLSGILSSGVRGGGSRGGKRLRDILVVAQLALAVVLLAGAGLMLTSLRRLTRVDTGIAAANVLAVPLQLPGDYGDRQREFVREIVARAAALPGVSSAAVTVTNPYREWGYANDVTPVDRAATAPSSGLLVAGWRSVTPDFFRTLGVPVLRGRAFEERDREGAEDVVVISASLARQLWPNENALGRALYWGGTDGNTKQVVGVVGDVRDRQLDADPQPMLYLPYDQVYMPTTTLLLRTDGSRAEYAAAIRSAVWSIDPNLPVPEVTPLAQNREALAAGPRVRALLVSSFAAVALLLAALGVYSVMAYAVAQRTREIGLRMALGARPAAVAREVLGRGLAVTALGIAIGLAASVAAGRVAATLLYETSPGDLPTLAGVALLVTLTALAASWVPSRRATRVNPADSLRSA